MKLEIRYLYNERNIQNYETFDKLYIETLYKVPVNVVIKIDGVKGSGKSYMCALILGELDKQGVKKAQLIETPLSSYVVFSKFKKFNKLNTKISKQMQKYKLKYFNKLYDDYSKVFGVKKVRGNKKCKPL